MYKGKESNMVSRAHVDDPDWSVLPDIEHMDLQASDVDIRGQTTCKCFSAYILVQFICVHVCSCKTYNGGSQVASSCICSE
jgi:hypothetical protein